MGAVCCRQKRGKGEKPTETDKIRLTGVDGGEKVGGEATKGQKGAKARVGAG